MVLLIATLTILFGTLFPIVADALQLGKYSVGPPYFNAVFLPLMAVLIAFMAVAPSMSWKETKQFDACKTLLAPAVSAVLVGVLFPAAYGGDFNWGDFNWKVALGVTFGTWLVVLTLTDVVKKSGFGQRGIGGLRRLSRSYWGDGARPSGFCVYGFRCDFDFTVQR